MSAPAMLGPVLGSPASTAPAVVAQVTGRCPAAVAAVQVVLERLAHGVMPARPSRWAGWRRRPDELVTVALIGRPAPVRRLAAAVADVVVVTGMSHHVESWHPAARDGWVRVDVTCYPARRIAADGSGGAA